MNAASATASRRQARRSRTRLATVLVLTLAACAPVTSEPSLGPLERADPQVALGERVFAVHCHQCHPNAREGLAPSIVGTPIPAWLIRVQVRRGLGQMPAFTDDELADEALDAIISYLSALRDAPADGGVAGLTAP
jgi:mono/diheme cytochrome c family protein